MLSLSEYFDERFNDNVVIAVTDISGIVRITGLLFLVMVIVKLFVAEILNWSVSCNCGEYVTVPVFELTYGGEIVNFPREALNMSHDCEESIVRQFTHETVTVSPRTS